jgi:hypothetical protein
MLGVPIGKRADQGGYAVGGWDEVARAELKSRMSARQIILDFSMNRVSSNGSQQRYRISGEPMFNRMCQYVGYRGVGVEVNELT